MASLRRVWNKLHYNSCYVDEPPQPVHIHQPYRRTLHASQRTTTPGSDPNSLHNILVADHIRSADSGTAAEVYSGTFLFVALAWNLLWQYAIRHPGVLARSVSDAEIKTTTRQFVFGPMLYVVAFIAAFFSGIASLVIILIVLAIYAFFAAITTIGGRAVENVQG